MPGTLPHDGDEIVVTVTDTKPFGAFVVSQSGVPGLVRGAQAAVGTTVRVRVIESDDVEHRFAATLV